MLMRSLSHCDMKNICARPNIDIYIYTYIQVLLDLLPVIYVSFITYDPVTDMDLFVNN